MNFMSILDLSDEDKKEIKKLLEEVDKKLEKEDIEPKLIRAPAYHIEGLQPKTILVEKKVCSHGYNLCPVERIIRLFRSLKRILSSFLLKFR